MQNFGVMRRLAAFTTSASAPTADAAATASSPAPAPPSASRAGRGSLRIYDNGKHQLVAQAGGIATYEHIATDSVLFAAGMPCNAPLHHLPCLAVAVGKAQVILQELWKAICMRRRVLCVRRRFHKKASVRYVQVGPKQASVSTTGRQSRLYAFVLRVGSAWTGIWEPLSPAVAASPSRPEPAS